MTLAIVLLAAGKGTRMNSNTQKILHEVGGKPMVMHIFEAAAAVADRPPLLVVAPAADGVRTLIGERGHYVVQAEQLGTGHAARMAETPLEGKVDQVIITYGDMPLLRAESLARLAELQAETGAALSMLTVLGSPESTFGRIIRGDDGRVLEIVEVAEAKRRRESAALLAITEHNVGVYCFEADFLWQQLAHLPLRQARSGQEYYLTDMVELAVREGRRVEAIMIDDAAECLGAGTRADLVAVERAFRDRANKKWLAQGVTLVDPATTYIDQDVVIGRDTVVWPNSYLQGSTSVGSDCIIGPNSIIRNAKIGDECIVEQAFVEGCALTDATLVAPFSIMRPPSEPSHDPATEGE